MKRISSNPKSAVSTPITAAIAVILIIVAVAGTYFAVGGSKTTTITSTTTTTMPGTTVTSTVTGQGTTVTSTTGTTVTSTTTSTTTSISLTSNLPAITVTEAGSSLVYPVFELWAPAFHTLYPTVQVNTAAGGSGSGQAGAEKGTLQLGASDAYLTDAQAAQYPYILNIPLAISAQQVNYNLPGMPSTMHLNLTGSVLAGIYSGTIQYWDNSAITSINPGATAYLTHNLIIPIHRSDGSGDSFLFTSYLSATSASWNSSVGFSTSPGWPSVPSAQGANGNTGMVSTCESTPYSIAYIGVSYLASTLSQPTPLGYAYLQNKAGNFVNISIANIQAAAAAMVPSTPADERISMIYAPGAYSYPIINYEYVMVAQNQTATGMALTLRTLLSWIISSDGGNSQQFLGAVSFIPLPSSTVQLTLAQIAKITGP